MRVPNVAAVVAWANANVSPASAAYPVAGREVGCAALRAFAQG
jgi:hypothetical protein